MRDILDARQSPGRILLVEDESLIQMLAIEYLEEAGFNVDAAGSAAEAMNKLALIPGGVDAAIVDMGLPDRKGDVLIREMRALHPTLPVIIATGQGADSLRDIFKGEPNFAFVQKPYSAVDLLGALRSQSAHSLCRAIRRPQYALRLHADGALSKIDDYSAGALAAVVPATAHDAESFFAAIEWAAAQPGLFWVRGRLTPAGRIRATDRVWSGALKHEKGDKKLPARTQHDPACLEEFDRRGHMIDVDSGVLDELRAAGVDIYRDPEQAARLVATFLPDWVRRGPLLWSLSGSSGVKGRARRAIPFLLLDRSADRRGPPEGAAADAQRHAARHPQQEPKSPRCSI